MAGDYRAISPSQGAGDAILATARPAVRPPRPHRRRPGTPLRPAPAPPAGRRPLRPWPTHRHLLVPRRRHHHRLPPRLLGPLGRRPTRREPRLPPAARPVGAAAGLGPRRPPAVRAG